MQEIAAAHDSVLRVVAVDQPVDAIQVGGPRDPERRRIDVRQQAVDGGGRLHHPLPRLRVGREPVGNAPPVAGLGDARERGEHVADAVRVPARRYGVLRAQPVGLALVVASEPEHQQSEPVARGVSEAGAAVRRAHRRDEDLRREQAEVRAERAAVGLHGVPRRDVGNLVAEHAGQLGLVVQVGHDAARQVDVAAGKREGVDGRRVDDGEMPVEIGPVGDRGQRVPHLLDEGLQALVRVDAHLAPNLDVRLATDGELLRLADRHELAVAGDRVRGARGGDRRARQPHRQDRVRPASSATRASEVCWWP